jgi:hypothetical protein
VEQVPDNFDWVSAQAKCSATSMFERLRLRAKEDVQRRNGLFDRNDGWKFEFHDKSDGFEVSRIVAPSSAAGAAWVQIERVGRRVLIHGDGVDLDLSIVVTLDGTGTCRCVIGEAIYTEWEVRKMALEQLFFEETDESE